jgi:hypothetical protein
VTNGEARADVGAVLERDVSAGISRQRGRGEGRAGEGFPGCLCCVFRVWVVGFLWACGLVVFGEGGRVQG